MVFQTALVAVSIVCVIWTVLPIFRAEAWYIRALEFPRIQVLIACISVFIAYAFAIGFRAPLDLFILCALGLCIFFPGMADPAIHTSVSCAGLTPGSAGSTS